LEASLLACRVRATARVGVVVGVRIRVGFLSPGLWLELGVGARGWGWGLGVGVGVGARGWGWVGGVRGGLRAILGEDLEGAGVDGLHLLLATVVEEALARLAPQVALVRVRVRARVRASARIRARVRVRANLFDKLVQHRKVATLHAHAEKLGRGTL
jgi:hypothetical protein